ncbi:prefoldin subunit 1 isoform X1 [Apodemus sylvaticus]|uniref:prefoldin subunit 1 isoform X1 n=1 Tax=Apodemus sylvaticus TaxID=10129 RepID=UPI002244964B|nr:prefoldin subunit 1 isoform X1 [Apodemus sylvaticus]
MAASVDLELKKAFTELQAKVIDTQQKVKLADIQIEQLNRTKKHAHLTDTEIMTLVDETNMYEGVGRMFILQSKEVIHNQLLEKQKIAEEKIKELECWRVSPGPSTFQASPLPLSYTPASAYPNVVQSSEAEQKKSYLERSVKEAEDNIREMLMARRAQ